MSVRGNYGIKCEFYHDGTSNSAGTLRETIDLGDSPLKTLDPGTGDGQIDLIWGRTVTLTATSATYDLTSLTDAFGASVNFAHVKYLLIKNSSTTDSLTVGNATSNPFAGWLSSGTTTETVGPGGILLKTDPKVGRATSGSSKNLKIDSGAATITFSILLAGTSV